MPAQFVAPVESSCVSNNAHFPLASAEGCPGEQIPGGQWKCVVVFGTWLVLISSLLLDPSFVTAQTTTFDSGSERQLINLINQERSRQGLEQLTVDDRLTQAARKHTALMVKHGTLSHQFDEEAALQQRLAEENVRSDKQGENVAFDVDVAHAHDTLMHSPPHRANILNPDYNAVGVGIVGSGDHLYVTEDFAHRTPDYSEPQADAAAQRAIAQFAASRQLPVPQRKPLPRLREMACSMALNDALDPNTPGELPGVSGAAVWTSSELDKLPNNVKGLLSQPLNGGYSLGVCFAPSVSHPGGVYWLVMVTY